VLHVGLDIQKIKAVAMVVKTNLGQLTGKVGIRTKKMGIKCKNICEQMALRVTNKQSRNFGKLKRFANFQIGERKCRFCNAVYSNLNHNLRLCPCCKYKLAVTNVHGNLQRNEKFMAVLRY